MRTSWGKCPLQEIAIMAFEDWVSETVFLAVEKGQRDVRVEE